MKNSLLFTLLLFWAFTANSQNCIDTVTNGLTLVSKVIVSNTDCEFKIRFCVRKVSEQAHHIVYTIKYSYGTLTRTIFIKDVAVGTVICEDFVFTADCSSTAYCAAHGKTVNHTLCGAVDDQILLPIKLVSFEAINQGPGLTMITWQTATETNVSHFVLQQSTDVRQFQDLAQLKAVGESKVLQNYAYEYKSLNTGTVNKNQYFRLKTVDRDGSLSYSPIILVKDKSKKKLTVYPNPTGNTIQFNSRDINPTDLKLFNIHGQSLQLDWLDSQSINLSLLQPGIYYIEYDGELTRFLKN